MRKNPYGPFAETVAAYQRATEPPKPARAKPKPYNGHHCWNCWNVSLWICNDEGLYNLAKDCIRRPRASGKPVSATIAANRFAEASGLARTPDGARYTFKAVRACMVGLMEE